MRIAHLILSAAMMLALPHPAGAADDFQLGVGVHLGQNTHSLQGVRTALTALEFTFRDEVFWSRIEQERGKLMYPANLANLNTLTTEVAQQGRRPLLVLDYGNALYEPSGQVTTAENIAAFARYAQFVVRQFKGRVDQFEVWNEWNIGMGWGGKPAGTAEAYVNLLRATYSAIKAENPNAVVIGGVVAQVDEKWIKAFGQAGGFRYLDAFSLHPYEYWWNRSKVRPKPPDVIEPKSQSTGSLFDVIGSAAAQTAFTPIQGTPEAAMAKLDTVKKWVDEFAPGRDLRIYVSEMSWPTSMDRYGVAETTAAAYAQRFILLARTRPWIAGVWWYDMFDDGDDDNNKEHRYGLFHRNGKSKVAYNALLAVKDILRSPATPTQTISAAGEVSVTGRLANGKLFKAAWLASDDFASTQASTEVSELLKSGYQHLNSGFAAGDAGIGAVPLFLAQQ